MSKKIVNVGSSSQKTFEDKLGDFSKKVFNKMELENVLPTPTNYKIYFQKTLLEEKDYEFRRYISSLNLREGQDETEKILAHEEKMDKITKLSIDMMQNIKSTYSKNSYLIKFIEESYKKSKSLVTQNAIAEFFTRLRKNVHQLHTSLKKDMLTIKELYSQNVRIIKELEQNKIFDTKFQVYKKEYFLGKLKKELELSKEMKFQSYLMLIKLNKETLKLLNTTSKLDTANKFFAKVLINKFRKSDILGHLGDGVFGVILSNLNNEEIKKVAVKFSDILNHSSLYLENQYIELHSVISITEIKGDCYIQITNKALTQLDLVFDKNTPYLIEED